MKFVMASVCGRPSVLIVKQLTNYLDHERLGVLILDIKDYKVGACVATEKWVKDKGMLRVLF